MSVPSTSTMKLPESHMQHTTVLTKTIGHPTYQSLVKLEMECKANGKSVPSTLGGSRQGYLGLIVNAMVYARISPNDPFIRPILPILPDLTGATVAVVAAERTIFDEALQAFHTCNLVKRIIVQQINTALDDDILPNMVGDVSTGLLEGTIPEIFQSLYRTYGKISPQALAAARKDTEAIVYNHSRPIVNLFTQINKYMLRWPTTPAPPPPKPSSSTLAPLCSPPPPDLQATSENGKPSQNSTKPGRPSKHISLKHKRPSMTVNLLSQPIRSGTMKLRLQSTPPPASRQPSSPRPRPTPRRRHHNYHGRLFSGTTNASATRERYTTHYKANKTKPTDGSPNGRSRVHYLQSPQTQVQQNQNPPGRRQGRGGGGNNRNNRNQDNRNQGNDNRNRNQNRPKCYCHSHGWCTHTAVKTASRPSQARSPPPHRRQHARRKHLALFLDLTFGDYRRTIIFNFT
jgi:hypothetical protein